MQCLCWGGGGVKPGRVGLGPGCLEYSGRRLDFIPRPWELFRFGSRESKPTLIFQQQRLSQQSGAAGTEVVRKLLQRLREMAMPCNKVPERSSRFGWRMGAREAE